MVHCHDANGGLTSIVADEYGAGSAAARVLIEAGHSRIGVVAGPLSAMDSRLRLEGTAAAAAEHIAVSVQTFSSRDISAGFQATSALLLAGNAPTALICIHERLAAGALLAAASLNVGVPNNLSLVSLEDGEQLASQLVPRLTTIERPDRAMAEKAVSLTLRHFDEDTEQSNQHLTFSCSAAPRHFCGGSAAAQPSTVWPSR